MDRWTAATDGSALTDPVRAGWAWAVARTPAMFITDWEADGCGAATSHRAELLALINLLRFVPPSQPLAVHVDSQAVIRTATRWRHIWRRNGWRRKNSEEPADADLVQVLDELLEGRDVEFIWVKAHLPRHSGDPLNFFVDQAARAAAEGQTRTTHQDTHSFPAGARPAR